MIACVLKSYLRDLPDPLLTYRLYDEFVSVSQRPNEEKRKTALLNAVNQLPAGHYFNLRYLTKFLSLLAQKSQHNKMSSQNIAIVMSPNLLWPPDTIDIDYVQKVNSSAAVNTVVELLVSDWSFFFDGDVDFYVTMTRDDLFPDNGGFAYDRDPPLPAAAATATAAGGGSSDAMTKSMHVAGTTADRPNNYQTHSRSSSHDTSQILLGSGCSDSMKRSQSSSSLSDTSPPQSSPKLPVRRKHNKQAAPTPPDTAKHLNSNSQRNHYTAAATLTESNYGCGKRTAIKTGSDGETDDTHHRYTIVNKSDNSSQTPGLVKPPVAIKRFGSNDNLIGKPEKPPRPVFVSAECQTLNRHSYRSKAGGTPAKPIALPRNILNVTKSNENLSQLGDNDDFRTVTGGSDASVVLRDKTGVDGGAAADKPDKPAIPERPVTLMRPASFKGMTAAQQLQDNNHGLATHHQYHHHPNFANHFDASMRKNSNFRSTGSVQQKTALNGGGITAGSLTTLERTHIYNVDKKQVAIIDVGGGGGNGEKKQESTLIGAAGQMMTAMANNGDSSAEDKCGAAAVNSIVLTDVGAVTSIVETDVNGVAPVVPPSPRGFDPKIKRPQIPAPPPPTNRPKSGEGPIASDSTNL